MMDSPPLPHDSLGVASSSQQTPPTATTVTRRHRPLPGWIRRVSMFMLPVYLLTSLPGYVLAEAEQTAQEVSAVVAESLKPAPVPVKVNRTLPAGVVDDEAAKAPASWRNTPLTFSATPKDGDFFLARLFGEPLVPTDGKMLPGENIALAHSLVAFSDDRLKATTVDIGEQMAPLAAFLAAHPTSRWGLSLWLNLGLAYRQSGYWTRALDAWEHAWAAGKNATSANARALADRAVAELAELNARLGRYERLRPLLAELDATGRDLRGSAADKLAGARQGLWMMDNHPEAAFRCGPMALDCLRTAANPQAAIEPKLVESKSTRQGISLADLASLSREVGRPMQMAFRLADKQGKGGDFIAPAVVHWKAGHYAALVTASGGRYRVDDPTFGDTTWVSRAALEAETDGYFLVPANLPLPERWREVSTQEGGKVWGKGNTNSKDPRATGPRAVRCKNCPPPYGTPGMATYNMEAMLTSLAIGDTPLSYSPPRGGTVAFGLEYSQHEGSQPAVPTSWNLGPKWTSNWLSYVEDNNTPEWFLVRYDSYTSGDSTTFYPVWEQTGGVFTGPLPTTYLPGGGVESYQQLTQSDNFVPPYDYDPVGTTVPIDFTYASQDQPVVYRNISVAAALGGFAPGTGGGSYAMDPRNPPPQFAYCQVLVNPRLVQTSASSYKRHLPDGTVETFAHSDQAVAFPRRIFLTERRDPSGNTQTFSYDSSHRLVAVSDALGQVSTLSYELPGDPLKVTRVTDPFGRSCQLTYNADGQLASITDTAGLQSSFTYADNDFIDSMTTPYGSTTFAFGDVTTDPSMGVNAWIEATDAYGDTERAEYHQFAPGMTFTEVVEPQGLLTYNSHISDRNTFYWDKKTYKESRAPDGSFDFLRAKVFHFLRTTDYNVCSGVLESTKEPLENRVWLAYQGQTVGGKVADGMSTQPCAVARVLDDGSTQLYRYDYNDQNRVTRSVDPLGRETTYTYDPANGIDLQEVANTTGGMHERLSAVSSYTAAHQPLELYDAAGQKTVMTYNSFGQPLTVTDTTQRTATLQYDDQGYLLELDGFDPAIKTTYTYDGYGRLATATTYPDGYTLQMGYDAVGGNPLATLNRSTTVTHPDGSYTEIDYTNLDVEWMRDRGGNWTHLLTNKLRQLEVSIDPLGQVTQYGYCKCGQLVKIIDPNGNVTRWKLDAQDRPSAKVYADNTEITYTYENTTSRLKLVTDTKGQHTHYTYNLDGAVQSVTYTETEHPTPGVSYTYDPLRGRLATMQDNIGTTSYSYYPYGNNDFGAVGAGKVQSVSGPFDNETLIYEYDALGRTTKRTVNGVAETYAFDTLGRLQTDTNALGTFTYSYDGVTGRLMSLAYPNGQQAQYSYLPSNVQERRLSQIKHLTPTGVAFEQFDYTYDGPLGRVAHWGQQQPGTSAGATTTNNYDLSYDAGGRLKAAVLNGDSGNIGSGVWSYDAADNRTGIQAGSGTLTTAIPTTTNALFSLRGGGKLRVAGLLNKWANVTVNGQAASVDASANTFEAFIETSVGNQTLSVNAIDVSGNTATSRYQLAISAGAGEDFSYDAGGNTIALTLTEEGTIPQILDWDACNRNVAIRQGNHRTEFGYDGQANRVRITEKETGQIVSDRLYVAGEERDAASGQVLRRFFGQGEQRSYGANVIDFYYASDHLGSTRTLTDSSGEVRASYTYEPWGTRRKLGGDLDTEVGFTGYWHHSASGLDLSATRLYSAAFGRFISKDPIQEDGGLNLYRYCGNDPINRIDPYGSNWIMTVAGSSAAYATANATMAWLSLQGVILLALEAASPFLAAAGIGAGLGYLLYETDPDLWANFFGEPLGSGESGRYHPCTQSASPPMKPPKGPPTISSDWPNSPNGDNESNARGREAHKWWQPPEGYQKEFEFSNGLRADAINFETQDILELKPNNPKAIARGQQQIQKYIDQAQQQFGGTWTGRVVTY